MKLFNFLLLLNTFNIRIRYYRLYHFQPQAYFNFTIAPVRANCFFIYATQLYKKTTPLVIFSIASLMLIFFKTLKISYFFLKLTIILKHLLYPFRKFPLLFKVYNWFLLTPRLYLYTLRLFTYKIFYFIPRLAYTWRKFKKIRRIKKKLYRQLFLH
jgi:hypothetical protein